MSLSDKIYADGTRLLVEDIKEFIKQILEPLTDLTKPLSKKEYYKFICNKAGKDLK